MPVGDKQKLITEIVSEVLSEAAQTDKKFGWFINKHTKEHFGQQYSVIDNIFKSSAGNPNKDKKIVLLNCDAYFGGKYNFIFEFDEFQHFSLFRQKTIDSYPKGLKLNFDLGNWKQLCSIHKEKADNYRKSKRTVDFDFIGGRTAQRAYLDCFRDLLPQIQGLNPTLRINEFEVVGVYTKNKDAF